MKPINCFICICQLFMSNTHAQSFSTSYSDRHTLVLQILPGLKGAEMQVNGKSAFRTLAMIFLPTVYPNQTLSCPINYFQENASLSGKWIVDDSLKKMELTGIENLSRVIVTKKINGKEELLNLPLAYAPRLFEYFMLDITHNLGEFRSFDCYAFTSLIANVKYFPRSPAFEYLQNNPKPGDIVVLASAALIPDSIKHWAPVPWR